MYFPDADLGDGAAEDASHGFFDIHNCPPWDSWVASVTVDDDHASYVSGVVCWIPQVFVAAADAGVAVNPEGCIRWIDSALAAHLGLPSE